jgi:putative ABC transport system substrate-binding protein
MRRREFVSLICGAAAWPLAARAQQPGRVRRIGVLMGFTAGDAEGLERARTIAQELQNRGWRDNYSARIDYRWPGGDTEQIQALARELVSLSPDVLIADGTAAVWHYGR